MRIYIHREHHWDWSETLGVYTEERMLREKQKLIEQVKVKRDENIAQCESQIEELKIQLRALCVQDQNENVPRQQEAKASGDKVALRLIKSERKPFLKKIDQLNAQISQLNWRIFRLKGFDDEQLLGQYFSNISFEEHYVLD